MRRAFVLRIRLISGVLLLFALVLVGRLYDVQIVNGDAFAQRAERQYVRPSDSVYDRGTIFFQDKAGRLIAGATIRSGYKIAINPTALGDPERTYQALADVLKLDREDFLARARKDDDPYEEVAHRLSEEEADAVTRLELSGVQVLREAWRFYPGEELAAQTLGFVGYDDNTRSGRYGLERYYEDALKRRRDDVYVNYFAEIFSSINETLFAEESDRQGDLVTTIEPSVQLQLEDALVRIDERWGGKRTGGLIIDPMTGSVYAMAAYPTFDVNRFSEVDDTRTYSNPLVENVYEMGSIIKPLTMAIGIETGAVTPQTTYYDQGHLELDGYTIHNFDGRGRGEVNMQEVLSQSLNTGVAFVVSRTGHEQFAEYMQRFEIGEETGIDLPNEAKGLVSNLESPRAVEYATASFGQGIALTPIATARALSALAAHGVLMTPHVGDKLVYPSGLANEIGYPDGTRVISEETSETVTRMLVEVVDEALKGGTVAMEHYSIAAKTGTAQIAKSGERGYYDDRFLHSFFGYFPAYEPRFLIFLYTVEPRGVRYASQTLTDPFMELTDFLINYYEIPPDR